MLLVIYTATHNTNMFMSSVSGSENITGILWWSTKCDVWSTHHLWILVIYRCHVRCFRFRRDNLALDGEQVISLSHMTPEVDQDP